MTIQVHFYSFFREKTGCADTQIEVPHGATLGDLIDLIHQRFPALKPFERSTLLAVGVDYQPRSHLLQAGDMVSFFPPVQGG